MPDAPTPLDLDAIRAVLDRGVAATGGEWFHALRSCIDEVERLRAEVAMTARPAPAWDEEAIRRAEAHVKLDGLGADLGLLVDVAASGIPADVLRPILRTYSHAAIDVIPRPLGPISGVVA